MMTILDQDAKSTGFIWEDVSWQLLGCAVDNWRKILLHVKMLNIVIFPECGL